MVIVLKHKRNKQKKQDRIEDINKTLFDNGASDIIKNRCIRYNKKQKWRLFF